MGTLEVESMKELLDEYAGSRYTYSLKAVNVKVKTNASQRIQHIREIPVKSIKEIMP